MHRNLRWLLPALIAGALSGCPGSTPTPGGDTTPPTISSSQPTHNADAVPVNSKLVLNFSEAMQTGSVKVTSQPSITLGVATWNPGRTALTYTPTVTLGATTAYTLTISGQDDAGNALSGRTTLSFKTSAVSDTTAPSITSSDPASGTLDVPRAGDRLMTVTFSEAMNQNSLKAQVSVTCRYPLPNCATDNLAVQLEKSANALTVRGSKAFTEATYSIKVSGTDLAGNALQAAPLSFTTEKDSTGPTATLLPANGSNGVPRDATLSVAFSEAMNFDSLSTGIQLVLEDPVIGVARPQAAPLGFNLSKQSDSDTYILRPNQPLPYGSRITLRVTSAARDLSGNPATPVSSSLDTINFAENFPVYVIASMDGHVVRNCGDNGTNCSLNAIRTAKEVFIGHSFTPAGSIRTSNARGFVGFNLTDLRAAYGNTIRITDAKLSIGTLRISGNPFATLGNLLIERVAFGDTLTTAAYDTPTLGCGNLSACVESYANAPERDNLVNVTRFVQQDFSDGNLSQYRLRFTGEPDTTSAFLTYSAYENAPDNPLYWPVLFVSFEYP